MFGADGSGLDAATATLVAKGWPDPIPLLHSRADRWRSGAEATPAETHSALFSLHMALLSVWRQLGVVPDAVMSFSMGEPSGAVACGALSEAAGAAVMSAMTSCVMTASEGMGGMLAVIGLTAEELAAQAAMQDGVEVGAVFGRAGGVRARERGEGETGEGVVFARGDDGDAARRRGEVRGGRGRDVVRGRRETHAQFKR